MPYKAVLYKPIPLGVSQIKLQHGNIPIAFIFMNLWKAVEGDRC